MINRVLIDALDDCIERLNRGQSVEDCLRVYPQLSQVLRPMLETGITARQLGPGEVETRMAQAHVWERLHQRSRRRVIAWKPIRRTLLAAAALVLIVFGALFALQSTASHILNPTPTLGASSVPTNTIAPSPSPTATPTEIPTPTLLPTPTVPTTDIPATDVPATDTPFLTDTPSVTDTNTPYVLYSTDTATPTATYFRYPTFTPTANPTNTAHPYPTNTPTPTYNRYLTYTAIAEQTARAHPTYTPTPTYYRYLTYTAIANLTATARARPTYTPTATYNRYATYTAIANQTATARARPTYTPTP